MIKDTRLGEHPVGLALACGLALLAGAVDAAGLARLKDLFVSFMSGNTTSLGVAIGAGNAPRAAMIAARVALFVAGAAVGEALAIAAGRWRVPVVTLGVAAALAVPLAAPSHTVTAMVLAMGALNAAMPRAGGTNVTLTFVTGTLVRLGQGLGRALCGRRNGWAWLLQSVPWLGLLCGAAATTGLRAAGVDPVPLLPGLAAALALAAWRLEQ